MKTSILALFFALLTTIAFITQQPNEPATPTTLTYSIKLLPPALHAVAESLGIAKSGYVPPKFYTKTTDGARTFNLAKAEKNLDAIKAICDGAPRIITDIELKHRAVVRHPDDYSDAELKAAVEQYVACWSWFRSHWPNALIFEWNMCNARKPGLLTFAEGLTLKHLDGFLISLYPTKPVPSWLASRQQMIAHARTLIEGTDKIIIGGIRDRYKVLLPDGVTELRPVARNYMYDMLTVAYQCDGIVFWSNTYGLFEDRRPNKRLTELIRGDDNPLFEINAHVVRLMAEMKLGVAP